MVALQVVGGLVLLFACGDLFVRASVGVALRLGVSPLMIGLTLVGFGTSLPELVASLEAARLGSPGIAVGNVVGSNIANILLILGVSALIAPLAVARGALRRDGTVLVLVTLLAVGACLWGRIGWWVGLAFLGLLAAYVVQAYRTERKAGATGQAPPPLATGSCWDTLTGRLALTAVGLLGIVVGAGFLVRGAVVLARDVGLSETVIGLTVVAVGTSLPELATSVIAAMRRHGDIALGNIIGSNIFNILGILGVTALVSPIAVPAQIMAFDGWAMLAATGLLIVFALTRSMVERWEGAVLLAAYGGYLSLLLLR